MICKKKHNPCGCDDSRTCIEKDCSCEVKDLSTDCVTYTGDDLECSLIKKGTILTELIQQLDEFICDKFSEVEGYFALDNVGVGASLYKGIGLSGKKEIKSITKTGDLIKITGEINEVDVTIDEDALETFITQFVAPQAQTTYEIENLSNGAEIYAGQVNGDPVVFNMRTLKSTDSSVIISQETNHIDLKVTAPSGTVIQNGINTTISGTGTSASPYKVNAIGVKIDPGTNTTVVGEGTVVNPYKINSPKTKLEAGTNTTLSGDGTTGNPYKISSTVSTVQVKADVLENSTSSSAYIENKNPTKTVSPTIANPYTISATDNNYVIEINNLTRDVSIIVPSTLPENFFVGFVQKGTGKVTFTGIFIIPVGTGYTIYGQGHVASIETIGATKYLHGTLKL